MIPERPRESSAGPTFLFPRYEDVTQDGRIVLTSIMPGLGTTVWKAMLDSLSAANTFRAQGILPILSRLVIEAESSGPFTVYAPLRFEGAWCFARERNGSRIFLNMWMDARAPIGSTFARPPKPDAETVVVARVFAEHVVTKPFAPPGERRVTTLEGPGLPDVATLPEHVFEAAEDLSGGDLAPAGDFVFGMMHTDSNQHVNSLVYPRVFEEALLRHLASPSAVGDGASSGGGGVDAKSLLARSIEMRWRKPFFSGERADISLATKAPPAGSPFKLGAAGTFRPAGAPLDTKPSCAIAVWMG